MTFGLIANLKRIGAESAVHACIKWADETGQKLVLSDDLRPVVTDSGTFCPRESIASDVDVIISMGGDGTMLATAREVGNRGTPILGINLGSLGFLTQQQPPQLVSALNAVLEGRHNIERRMLLETEVVNGEAIPSRYALNDVVLNNGPISRLLDISLSVGGENVVTYKADGLVVATPTGSTAYNLAVGGPIMHPEMEAMIVAPISPFSLTTRPMIFRPSDTLELQVQTPDRESNLTLDGQVAINLSDEQKVRVSRAGFYAHFVVFEESSYYHLLRTKLNWGIPPNYSP
jgi:NAD+ kinase